ncbi:MAG: hypothetical protein ACR2JC_21290 [Chloroflexota bacterium]
MTGHIGRETSIDASIGLGGVGYIVVDSHDMVYVADIHHNQIVKLSSTVKDRL